MGKNEILLQFYNDLVKLSQEDILSGIEFYEQAAMCMLSGHVYDRKRIVQLKAYETLLLWNLSYNVYKKNIEDEVLNPYENLIKIFKDVDAPYYESLINTDTLLAKELLYIVKLAFELENDKNNPYIKLLEQQNPALYESYNGFSNLKNIIRTGWIKRNVQEDYCESDSIHIMQMFAFASAYFRLFKPSIDFQRVVEMILIHEMGENIAGDIPEGDKAHASKHDIEALAVTRIFENLNNGEYFINLWNEFEERQTEEAKFVYQLDKLDPILKAKYLDEVLNREDLYDDFFSYEDKRGTFKNGAFAGVFLSLKKKD